MTIQLIKGEFSPIEALELITQMVAVKIKYHENKINITDNEEDSKSREAKIKYLQNELLELRNKRITTKGAITIDAILKID